MKGWDRYYREALDEWGNLIKSGAKDTYHHSANPVAQMIPWCRKQKLPISVTDSDIVLVSWEDGHPDGDKILADCFNTIREIGLQDHCGEGYWRYVYIPDYFLLAYFAMTAEHTPTDHDWVHEEVVQFPWWKD